MLIKVSFNIQMVQNRVSIWTAIAMQLNAEDILAYHLKVFEVHLCMQSSTTTPSAKFNQASVKKGQTNAKRRMM